MKCAIIQQAIRSTNGTQDWTDPGINNDFQGAIFWGAEPAANNTTGANSKFFFGATDGVRNISFNSASVDATAAASAASSVIGSNTACYMRTTSSGAQTVLAAVQSVLATGVRLNFTTTDGGSYLLNALLLSGPDIEFEVSSVLFSSSDTSKVVTHNDTAAPQTVIALCAFAATGTDSAAQPQQPIIGIWDGTTMVGSSMQCSATVNPTALAGRQAAGDMGHMIIVGGSDGGSMSIGSVGPTTFTFSRTATNSVPMFCVFVSIRSKAGTWMSQVGQTTLPTSTGVAPLVTGLPSVPQVLLTFPTRLTTTAFVSNSDTAGSFGMGGACNNAGVTQQGATAYTEKNAVATTVCKSYTTQGAVLTLDNTGVPVNQATVASWDSTDITLNHSAVGASAFEMMYLTFGIFYPTTAASSYALSSDEYF